LAKRQFTIDTGKEQIPVEGQVHRNVAVKYLMKRRRSLLMTKNPEKVEKLFTDLPKTIKIIGKQLTREYKINWERMGTEEFEGSRFVFTLDDVEESTKK
jgi:alpha-glucuronidase